MRTANYIVLLPALMLALATHPLRAQALGQTSDGARPGNDIGTGMSLPRSNKASNMDAATTKSELAPNLPAPAGEEHVQGLLLDARAALTKGQTGAAQEALERAESRALSRSVPYGAQRTPAGDNLIEGITKARAALARNQLLAAIQAIDAVRPLAADQDLPGQAH